MKNYYYKIIGHNKKWTHYLCDCPNATPDEIAEYAVCEYYKTINVFPNQSTCLVKVKDDYEEEWEYNITSEFVLIFNNVKSTKLAK